MCLEAVSGGQNFEISVLPRDNIHSTHTASNAAQLIMKYLRRPSIKKLSLRRRWLGLTSMMRITCSKLEEVIATKFQTLWSPTRTEFTSFSQVLVKLVRIYRRLQPHSCRKSKKRLKRIILILLVRRHKIIAPPREL